MKTGTGPIMNTQTWRYVGISHPWHVFVPVKEGVPEMRFLSSATIYDPGTGTRKRLLKLLPSDQDYTVLS